MEKFIKNIIGKEKDTKTLITGPLNKLKCKDLPLNKDSFIMRR